MHGAADRTDFLCDTILLLAQNRSATFYRNFTQLTGLALGLFPELVHPIVHDSRDHRASARGDALFDAAARRFGFSTVFSHDKAPIDCSRAYVGSRCL